MIGGASGVANHAEGGRGVFACLAGARLIAWQAWRLKTPQERRAFERRFPRFYGATRPSLVWSARLIVLPVAVFVLWQLIFAG